MRVLALPKKMWYILCGILKLFSVKIKRALIKKCPTLFPCLIPFQAPQFWTINLRSEERKTGYYGQKWAELNRNMYRRQKKMNFEIISKAITKCLKGGVKNLTFVLHSLPVLQTRKDISEPILSHAYLCLNGTIDENERMLPSFNGLHSQCMV